MEEDTARPIVMCPLLHKQFTYHIQHVLSAVRSVVVIGLIAHHREGRHLSFCSAGLNHQMSYGGWRGGQITAPE